MKRLTLNGERSTLFLEDRGTEEGIATDAGELEDAGGWRSLNLDADTGEEVPGPGHGLPKWPTGSHLALPSKLAIHINHRWERKS